MYISSKDFCTTVNYKIYLIKKIKLFSNKKNFILDSSITNFHSINN